MLARITREPALILGVVTSGLSLAVLFGLDLTAEQLAQVGVFLGALMTLVRFLTTPASEVVAQVKPDGSVVAGDASAAQTGTPLPTLDVGGTVIQNVPVKTELIGKDEAGAVGVGDAVLIGLLIVLLLVLLGAIPVR